MSITQAEIESICRMARVPLTAEESEWMSGDLRKILLRLEALDRIELEGVAPLETLFERSAPLRADEAGAEPLVRPLSELAPAWEEGFFVVPRVAALDGEAQLDAEVAP